MGQDIRYALRMLRRSPGFTAIAILSLALGIGANTAILTLIDTLMLRRLRVREPKQLVELLRKYPNEPRGGYFSWRSYEHSRDHNRVFSGLAGVAGPARVPVRDTGLEPVTVNADYVTGDYFPVLGVNAAAGRAAAMIAMGLLAADAPARRAARVDPMHALRQE